MADPGGPAPEPSRLERREAWELVAERVRGELLEGRMPGGYAVDAEHGPWTLRLDLHMVSRGSSSLMHTRVWSYFVGRDAGRLVIRRKTFLDRILERFGSGPTRPPDRSFGRRYVARGRPESRVRSLLSGGLAEAVSGHDRVRVRVGSPGWWRRRSLGPDVRLMEILSPGVDTDVGRMEGMIDLGRQTLDVLLRTGTASAERPPEV